MWKGKTKLFKSFHTKEIIDELQIQMNLNVTQLLMYFLFCSLKVLWKNITYWKNNSNFLKEAFPDLWDDPPLDQRQLTGEIFLNVITERQTPLEE